MKTFLALYMGSPSADRAMPDEATMAKGMAAWGAWMAEHAAQIVDQGGPVGKTKKVGPEGISDIRNEVGGYITVRAESQEAAARMFEGHPQFMIFPGDRVEIMEVLPIPGS
jgi:hypothetical protein